MKRRSKPPRDRAQAERPRYRDLADYIRATGDTQNNIARRVGTSQATLSRILRLGRIPRSLLALRIAEYANIPLESFTRANLAKRAADAA